MSNLLNRIRHLDLEGVADAIRGGANLNKTNARGDTPLHVAMQEGSEEIAQLLLKAGASLTVKNSASETPRDQNPNMRAGINALKAEFEELLEIKPPENRQRNV